MGTFFLAQDYPLENKFFSFFFLPTFGKTAKKKSNLSQRKSSRRRSFPEGWRRVEVWHSKNNARLFRKIKYIFFELGFLNKFAQFTKGTPSASKKRKIKEGMLKVIVQSWWWLGSFSTNKMRFKIKIEIQVIFDGNALLSIWNVISMNFFTHLFFIGLSVSHPQISLGRL
jgi:hypothetical protein